MVARRLAVSVMPLENRREALVGLGVAAERLGYEAFTLPETWTYDVAVLLAEAAVKTSRITLGTGILGIWSRSPAAIAMAATALAAVAGGRLVLGLGASTPQLAEGLHDVPFEHPLARMRRTLVQVRALLRGERVPLAAVPSARPLRLNVPAPAPFPILLAGLADATIRLAGELADGWMPFLYARRALRDGIATMRQGAARGGDAGRPLTVWPSVPCVVEDDAERARAGAAWFVAFYVTTMGTMYRQALVRQGFDKAVEAVLAANMPKFTGAVPPDAEALLEELIVYGTPSEARARLARWYDAGADVVGLLLRPELTPEAVDFTLRAFR